MTTISGNATMHPQTPGDSRADAQQACSEMGDYLFRLLQNFKAYPTDWNERVLTNELENYRLAWMNMHAKP